MLNPLTIMIAQAHQKEMIHSSTRKQIKQPRRSLARQVGGRLAVGLGELLIDAGTMLIEHTNTTEHPGPFSCN